MACASRRLPPSVPAPPPRPKLFEWWGDGVTGKPSIRINLATQKAQFYRDGELVGWTTVATGKSEYPTRPGRFRIQDKIVDKISYTYGVIKDADGDVIDHDARSGREPIPEGGRFVGAPMPYWMRLTSYGIGMHAGVIPRPGRPASHGCIRLPREMAIAFYENAPIGTPVVIVDDDGSD